MAALIKYNVMKGTFYRGKKKRRKKKKKKQLKNDHRPNEAHFNINSR